MLIRLLLATALTLPLLACSDKPETTMDKVENKVDDALDNRPAEPVRDAVEDAGDKVEDAAGDAKDAVKDATN